ncbi:MAG: DUF1801 domain-containing protein [Acidobacteria bacterium]|nr:DUF1801 domain-containing protein [Acidobacteriota bacterium]
MAKRIDGEAQAFLDALEHARKAEILTLRAIVLGADKRIAEGVKWNSLSFRTGGEKGEWFATVNLREKQGVGMIVHFGAKKNAISESGVAIADPAGLLRWLAKDRAVVVFRDGAELTVKTAALQTLLREWITHV